MAHDGISLLTTGLVREVVSEQSITYHIGESHCHDHRLQEKSQT